MKVKIEVKSPAATKVDFGTAINSPGVWRVEFEGRVVGYMVVIGGGHGFSVQESRKSFPISRDKFTGWSKHHDFIEVTDPVTVTFNH